MYHYRHDLALVHDRDHSQHADRGGLVADGHGTWRRDGERHQNVLVDTCRIPARLGEHGVTAAVGTSFGTAELRPACAR